MRGFFPLLSPMGPARLQAIARDGVQLDEQRAHVRQEARLAPRHVQERRPLAALAAARRRGQNA